MNIIKMDVDGDKCAKKLIVSKLFENSTNVSPEEADYEYSNVARDLEGLKVRFSKYNVTKGLPYVLIIQ